MALTSRCHRKKSDTEENILNDSRNYQNRPRVIHAVRSEVTLKGRAGEGAETLQSSRDLLLLDLGAGHTRCKHVAICMLKIWALSAFYHMYIKKFVLIPFKANRNSRAK